MVLGRPANPYLAEPVTARFSVEIDTTDAEEFLRQFRAICRLARLSASRSHHAGLTDGDWDGSRSEAAPVSRSHCRSG